MYITIFSMLPNTIWIASLRFFVAPYTVNGGVGFSGPRVFKLQDKTVYEKIARFAALLLSCFSGQLALPGWSNTTTTIQLELMLSTNSRAIIYCCLGIAETCRPIVMRRSRLGGLNDSL